MDTLYKYKPVGENKINIDTLINQKIYIPSLKQLNDPFEYKFIDFLTMMEQAAENLSRVINRASTYNARPYSDSQLEASRYYCGIYSMCESSQEYPDNELLWAHYADSHKGFCIAYHSDELIKYYEILGAQHIRVKYSAEPPILGYNHQNKWEIAFGYKSLAWAYEQEVRLIFPNPMRVFNLKTEKCPSRLIKAIYLGLYMKEENKRQIIEFCKKEGISCYEMIQKKNKYALEAKLVEDVV